MSEFNRLWWDKAIKHVAPTSKDFGEAANDLCEKAIAEAKRQLHPLLQNSELDRLDQRQEFLKAFKSAMEQGIARKLTTWHPGVQAVFQYDVTYTEHMEHWDGSIHLLVKVPRLSDVVKILGKKLDRSLVKSLKQRRWQRFQKCQSILDVQQVTPNELRHGISYGAMFYAVYTVPVKVWPQNKCVVDKHNEV
jgi:hypothetical protein